jgi:ferredoxin-NADP reductase
LERLTRPRIPVVWRVGTVVGTVQETPRAKTLQVEVPGWPGHVAGQSVDIRLTADDGYQAQRSYSIGSAPAPGRLELTVEEIEDGEVSPYLVEELGPGDPLELRGPIGGQFTWMPEDGGPLLLVAGGSGLVPLMSMLRHRAAERADVETHVLVSVRRLEELFYREELAGLDADVHITLTRERPDGWTGFDRRVDSELLRAAGMTHRDGAVVFICGSNPFVEAAAAALVPLGHTLQDIRTERFGPSGGV